MSRPINLPILERAREGVLVKAPGTLLDELVDEFGCGRRTANRYIARARREVAAETAARMGERVGMFYAKLDRAVEEAKARGNDSAVMQGLKVEREALGLGAAKGGTVVNVAVMQALGAAPGETFDKCDVKLLDDEERDDLRRLLSKAAGHDVPGIAKAPKLDTSRLTTGELELMHYCMAKMTDARAELPASAVALLAHFEAFMKRIECATHYGDRYGDESRALLRPTRMETPGHSEVSPEAWAARWVRTAHGGVVSWFLDGGPDAAQRALPAHAPTLLDDAQDAADAQPEAPATKPAMTYERWQAERSKAAAGPDGDDATDAPDPDAPEPELFGGADE